MSKPRLGGESRAVVIFMNVVQVCEERREAFERAFLERESHVHEAPGFAGFELLRRDRAFSGIGISPRRQRWQMAQPKPTRR